MMSFLVFAVTEYKFSLFTSYPYTRAKSQLFAVNFKY